jgi:hypothetical protein
MPCPFTSVLGVGAGLGGAHTLLVRDHRCRVLAWTTLLLTAAGWACYFAWWRETPFRIALEVLSVSAVVAGALRVRRLMRTAGVRPPLFGTMARLAAPVWPVLGAPAVLTLKVWIAAMLVMEWRGKARFDALEYGAATALLLAAGTLRVVRLHRARSRFSALESFATWSSASACPLGFGCTTGEERAGRAAPRASAAPRAEAGVWFAEPAIEPAAAGPSATAPALGPAASR